MSPNRRLTEEEQALVWQKPASHVESDAERRICDAVKRNWNRGEMKITNILLEGDAGSGKTQLAKALSADFGLPYSLDCEDGIEYSACVSEPTPQELLERMELFCHLCAALNSLPETQGRRVDACVILGKSYSEVARAESVHESAVRRSVERGLEKMKQYLKKCL